MKTLAVLFLMICWHAGRCQYRDDLKTLGDKAWQNKDYYEAAFYYKKVARGLNMLPASKVPYQPDPGKGRRAKEEDETLISYRLAESFRLYENYSGAEEWYQKVLNENLASEYPLARLWYGVCLRAGNRFEEAVKQLEQFLSQPGLTEEMRSLAGKEIRNCRFAMDQMRFPVFADLRKLSGSWNSDGSNYAIIPARDNLYFTSSRNGEKNKQHLNRVYTVQGAEGSVQPQELQLDDPDPEALAEFGTPALDIRHNVLYLTRWYKKGKKEIHAIYSARLTGGVWKLRKLNSYVNFPGYDAIQPFYSETGNTLYFASDKPGGSGGYDLWVSRLDAEGEPVSAMNLGAKVNTAFDEQSPWIDEREGRLVFSSKGFTGIGGFDVFESRRVAAEWSSPVNLGFPVNSAKDDLYYFPYEKEQDGEQFYMSSDRGSECCLETFAGSRKSIAIAGRLSSCGGNVWLANALITMVDSLSGARKQIFTNSDGRFSFSAPSARPIFLTAEKAGYFSKSISPVLTGGLLRDSLQADLCLMPFKAGKPIVLENVLFDFGSGTLREESRPALDAVIAIMKDNPGLRIELGAHTDSIGNDAANLSLSYKRAFACVSYIVNGGISDARLIARGYGESKPVAPNSTSSGKDNPPGRQMNRRTEFTVIGKD